MPWARSLVDLYCVLQSKIVALLFKCNKNTSSKPVDGTEGFFCSNIKDLLHDQVNYIPSKLSVFGMNVHSCQTRVIRRVKWNGL